MRGDKVNWSPSTGLHKENVKKKDKDEDEEEKDQFVTPPRYQRRAWKNDVTVPPFSR